MKTTFKAVLLTLCATLLALAVPVPGGGPKSLTNSPSPLGVGYVQQVRVRVIPGYQCKVYVGASYLNRSTYAGTYAVLYPNATGGWSEEWALADPRGMDGIDLSQIYVAGDCSGEQVTVFWYQTGSVPSAKLTPFSAGPKTPGANYVTIWGGSTTLASVIQVWVIPGFVGKIDLARSAGFPFAVLYPNTGNPAQSSARSERWELYDQSSQLRPDLILLATDVPGESALVTLWKFGA
jgi:hypothetical protein